MIVKYRVNFEKLQSIQTIIIESKYSFLYEYIEL
jgi:hypothetical protein